MGSAVSRGVGAFLLVIAATGMAAGQISQHEKKDPVQTADMPDSWLVLFNANSAESTSWASWYKEQWAIPDANLLGLDASLDEHLPDLASVQTQIINPVRTYLLENPDVAAPLMGIVLGYRLPGHYASPPVQPNVGGFSIADALQDMTDDTLAPVLQKGGNYDNPHYDGAILPVGGRLTRATMQPGRYMVARIDGPTVDDAMMLTTRAKLLSAPAHSLEGDLVWHDWQDPAFPPASHEWYWLKAAVQNDDLADLPWAAYDLRGADGPSLPWQDAFQFSIYRVFGWSAADFATDQPGNRVLGFHFNSFGAVTVRSTTALDGLYVPNALAAGYAAAIGATGEPICCIGPFPDTVLASLREGWTLGEAFYLANPYNDWMWTLVGDPLLRLPNWLGPVLPGPGDGDMNGDGVVDGLDLQPFVDVMVGAVTDPQQIARADLDGNGILDLDDSFLFIAPCVFGTYDWTVLWGTGDANGDSKVNGSDVQAFVEMVLNGTAGEPVRKVWAADMNKDGAITLDDLPLFVEALLNR